MTTGKMIEVIDKIEEIEVIGGHHMIKKEGTKREEVMMKITLTSKKMIFPRSMVVLREMQLTNLPKRTLRTPVLLSSRWTMMT
jgi:hypothetical protein